MLRRLVLAVLAISVCACSNAAPVPSATAPGFEATPTVGTTSPSVAAQPTAAVTSGPASASGFAGTNWPATAAGLANNIGQRFAYQCPPDGVNWYIYGTGVYTSDSSVCTAAVHMGLITLASGGEVTIEMRPGQDAYTGSDRNGIHSAEYGAWAASFVFVDSSGVAIVPSTETPTQPPTQPPAVATASVASRTAAPPATPTAGALAGELLQAGTLSVCSSFPSVRFAEFDANGDPFGVNVEIANGLADRLGLIAQFTDEEFAALIDAVEQRRCDISVASQFITQERLTRIDMIPYMQGTQHLVVRDGNPLGIDEPKDLCGKTVAVVGGTVQEDMLRGNGEFASQGISQQCTAGAPPISVAVFADEGAAEAALLSDAADAYIGNDFITEERPDEFDLSLSLLPVHNGIAHRLGLANLDAALRDALRSMITDGSYDEILDKYDVSQVRLTELP